jgi:hypothetical protein
MHPEHDGTVDTIPEDDQWSPRIYEAIKPSLDQLSEKARADLAPLADSVLLFINEGRPSDGKDALEAAAARLGNPFSLCDAISNMSPLPNAISSYTADQLEAPAGEDLAYLLATLTQHGPEATPLAETLRLAGFTPDGLRTLFHATPEEKAAFRDQIAAAIEQLKRNLEQRGGQLPPIAAPWDAIDLPGHRNTKTARMPNNIVFHDVLRDVSNPNRYKMDERGHPCNTRVYDDGGKMAMTVRVPQGLQEHLGGTTLVSWRWDQIRQLDRMHKWILLIVAIHALHTAPQTGDPLVIIDAKTFLDTIGRQPYLKPDDGMPDGRRTAGHHVDDRIEIDDVLERLSCIIVEILLSRKRGKKPIRWRSTLLMIEDRLDVPGYPTRYRLRIGNWFWAALGIDNAEALTTRSPHYARILNTILRYHKKYEVWEGDIGLSLQLFSRITYGEAVELTPRYFIRENGLPINRSDPQKTRERLEKALTRVHQDGVIGAWRYDDDVPRLPTKGWLDTWLDQYTVIIEPPAWQRETYRAIGEKSRAHRAKRQRVIATDTRDDAKTDGT